MTLGMNTNRIDKRCWIAIVALGAVVVVGATVTHAQAPPPPQHAEIQAGPHGWSAWMGAGVGSRIGVSIRDVERAEQDDGLTEGVVVADVLEEGPARTAGMETGDVAVWAETSPRPSRTISTSRTSTSGLAAHAWVWR